MFKINLLARRKKKVTNVRVHFWALNLVFVGASTRLALEPRGGAFAPRNFPSRFHTGEPNRVRCAHLLFLISALFINNNSILNVCERWSVGGEGFKIAIAKYIGNQ